MREINVAEITENIKEMCIEANHILTQDMDLAMKTAVDAEKAPLGPDPQDPEAREQLSWAAHNALANGGMANGHAVAHAIGACYHLVHGHACIVTLPAVIRPGKR